MKSLLSIHPNDVGATSIAGASLRERRAARAVMLNHTGSVYLLHMRGRGYYKLPGGGIEEGETPETALHRELLEECGTEGEIVHEIGMIEEFREDEGLHQISYCYLVDQKGGHVLPTFTKKEKKENPELFLVSSLKRAVELVEGSVPQDDESRFIQRRDSFFLQEARRLLGI